MNTLDGIQEEVQRLADELTPELLPMVLERMLARNTVTGCCERHDMHLLPYVAAQIILTRAKRNYLDDHRPLMQGENAMSPADWYHFNLNRRDEIRARYRSTPCTCWVPKR